MIFFAIRRKSDHAFLPALSNVRGYTGKAEPSLELPPRLFSRKAAAKACLRWWGEGAYRMDRSVSGWDGDYNEDLKLDKVEGRDAADFDVVEVRLKVIDIMEGAG